MRVFLIGALTLSLSNVASAQSGANRIRDFAATLTIRPNGSLDATEELTLRLAGASNEIVRDFSLRDGGAPSGSSKLIISILAVTDEDGQPLRTEESSADGGWTRRL